MPNSVIDFETTDKPARRLKNRKTSSWLELVLAVNNRSSSSSGISMRNLAICAQVFGLVFALVGSEQVASLSSSSLTDSSILSSLSSSNGITSSGANADGRQNNHLNQLQQQQQHHYTFDATAYKSVREAIRGHPELREFATLCEADGVKEIISMDKTPLTVFAPIDKSLSDLLAKSKSRSINLIELAKHHIAQGSVMEENTKFPLKFNTYSSLSPLYLNQPSLSSSSSSIFVNNAKILATHLIQIDAENYQTLHIIDQVVEFAYINRKIRAPVGNQLSSSSSSKKAIQKRSFNLDELVAQPEAAQEFHERFADIHANQPNVDLFHPRAFKGSQQLQRIALARDAFNLEHLARTFKLHPQLRGRLFQVNESSSLNTYFLPMNSDELDSLLDSNTIPSSVQLAILEAHVIPDQVLFTRTMALGLGHSSLFDNDSQTHKVALSLAKSLPEAAVAGASQQQPSEDLAAASDDSITTSRKFLTTPLLLQAKCAPIASTAGGSQQQQQWRSGITNAEILVANIPLSNGVLHLIKRPILVTETNVLDYINDNENQLSNVVSSVGSMTGSGQQEIESSSLPLATPVVVKVNKFRELLARERQMLSQFSLEPNMNKTILAPSDEAFEKLRFDLRALVQGDESLIPKHWDSSYRHDLLERLVKRHVILHKTLTTDQMLVEPTMSALARGPNGGGRELANEVVSENGKFLTFSSSPVSNSNEFYVESDSTRAKLVHHDLIGTNGVLHIIDRVLGEEQETVYSLLKSIIFKFNHSLEENNSNQNDLSQLIQANMRNRQQEQNEMMISAPSNTANTNSNNINSNEQHEQQQNPPSANNNPELSAISKSIGQYLDELAASNRRQLQILSSSVNISYQLAKLTSQADGLDDWNEKFKQADRLFTYFVPSDLAWIRLQQAQPELYKPLMYFLEQQQQQQQPQQSEDQTSNSNHIETSSAAPKPPRSSESSQRLRQILERHLVVNKKLGRVELNQLDSLRTVGATLRLLDQPAGSSQLTATNFGAHEQASAPTSAFAAFHSIMGGAGSGEQPTTISQQSHLTNRLKALRLESSKANIVQVNEASNGFVYIIDNVLLLPEDSEYIVQTSSAPAVSSTVSSLLGAHNSAILDFIQNLLAPSPLNMSAHSILALIATLTVAIAVLLVLALVLLVKKRQQSKLNRHQQLESGLTSSSSANSGSTSTTKSL